MQKIPSNFTVILSFAIFKTDSYLRICKMIVITDSYFVKDLFPKVL